MEKTKKKISWKKVIFTIFLISIAIVFIAAAGISVYKKKLLENFILNAPEGSTTVNSIVLEPSTWETVYLAGGTVRNLDTVNVIALSTGTVDQVRVKAGDRVKTGDLLIEIDSKAEKSNLAAQKAQLALLSTTYNRYQTLYKDGAISKFELDKARTDYQAQLNTVAATEANIEKKSIISPIDGVVGNISAVAGDVVNSGTNVVTVVGSQGNISRVDFNIPSVDVKNISIGNKVKITVTGFDLELTGYVSAINPTIDVSTGTVELQAIIDQQGQLTNGMFAKVEVSSNLIHDQLILPDLAINYNVYGSVAYKVVPLTGEDAVKYLSKMKDLSEEQQLNTINSLGRARFVPIKIIDDNAGYMLVEGVKPGDIVITNGINISEGALVKLSPDLGVNIGSQYKVGILPQTFKKVPDLNSTENVDSIDKTEDKSTSK